MKRLVVFFFFTILLVFAYPFWQGKVLFCCDNALIIIPARQFLAHELSQGRFPLWNDTILSGTPFVGDINLSPFYPGIYLEVLLSRFFDWYQVISFSYLIHIVLAFVGMYWSLKSFQTPGKSFVGACIYAFSGALVTYSNNLPMVYSAAVLPWVMGWLFRYLKQPNLQHYAIASLFIGLHLLSGHPQITLYGWLAIIVVGWFLGVVQKKLMSLCLVLLAGILIGAIQLLPFIEFVQHSTRVEEGVVISSEGQVPITAILRMVTPTINGEVNNGTDWWQGGTVYGFIGSSLLLLLLLQFFKRQSSSALARSAIAFFLLSFGVLSVPLFRVPVHFLYPYTIVGVFFIANTSWLTSSLFQHARAVGLGLLLLAGAALLSQLFVPYLPLVHHKLEYLGIRGIQYLLQGVAIYLLFLSCFFLLIFRLAVKYRELAIGCLLIVDAVLFSQKGLWTIPRSELTLYPQSVDRYYRYLLDQSAYPSGQKRQFGEPWLDQEMDWQQQILRPNLGILQGITYADGYASLISKAYQQYFGVAAKDPTGINVGNNQLALDRLGVRYVRFQDQVKERRTALPVFRFETKDQRYLPLSIDEIYSGNITITNLPDKEGRVVFATVYYPGWKAFVDGKEHPLQKHELLSVPVSNTTQKVQFIYQPISFFLGFLITMLSTTSLGVLAVLSLITKKIIPD